MSIFSGLAETIRRHPFTSLFDIAIWAVLMATATWAAFLYDLATIWNNMPPRERQISSEEALALLLLFMAGFSIFLWRRRLEEKQDRRLLREAEAELQEQRTLALADPLTDLPNRRKFIAALEKSITRQGGGAVYMLDLNEFKQINDELGHEAGDKVLQIIAQRFLAVLREGDLLARLGGDEFAVLARGVNSKEQAAEIGRRFLSALGSHFVVNGHRCALGVAVGAALIPKTGATAQIVLRRADIAMYEAKRSSTPRVHIFQDPDQGALEA